MESIKRDLYLNQFINRKENALIKIITGIRRCGKSYLLFNIYHDYLLGCVVKESNNITFALDDDSNRENRFNGHDALVSFYSSHNAFRSLLLFYHAITFAYVFIDTITRKSRISHVF